MSNQDAAQELLGWAGERLNLAVDPPPDAQAVRRRWAEKVLTDAENLTPADWTAYQTLMDAARPGGVDLPQPCPETSAILEAAYGRAVGEASYTAMMQPNGRLDLLRRHLQANPPLRLRFKRLSRQLDSGKNAMRRATITATEERLAARLARLRIVTLDDHGRCLKEIARSFGPGGVAGDRDGGKHGSGVRGRGAVTDLERSVAADLAGGPGFQRAYWGTAKRLRQRCIRTRRRRKLKGFFAVFGLVAFLYTALLVIVSLPTDRERLAEEPADAGMLMSEFLGEESTSEADGAVELSESGWDWRRERDRSDELVAKMQSALRNDGRLDPAAGEPPPVTAKEASATQALADELPRSMITDMVNAGALPSVEEMMLEPDRYRMYLLLARIEPKVIDDVKQLQSMWAANAATGGEESLDKIERAMVAMAEKGSLATGADGTPVTLKLFRLWRQRYSRTSGGDGRGADGR